MATPIITPDQRQQALLMSRMVAPPLPAAPVMAIPAPNLMTPAAPPPITINPKLGTQPEQDMGERQRLINTGSGVSQISNPFVRGLARVADIAGSVFTPNLAQAIPGTTLHHNMLVNQATQNVRNDQQEASQAATIQDEQARADLLKAQAVRETAKANSLDDPLKALDPSKTVTTDDGVYQLNPQTGKYDVRVGDKVEKPKTIEEQAYEYALHQPGADPLKAYSSVYGAKNVKDASLPQQYLDAIANNDATKAALIKRVINDTQTQPKITVLNAAAADHNASKNQPLDVSDPAMQASVAAVANGSLKLGDVFGRGATTAQKAAFAAAVKAVNPAYNSGDHDIENASRKYFTSGQGGQTLTAFNTAQTHLDILRQASDALNNGNITAFNNLAQSYAKATGDAAPTDFNAVKNAVKGEVARALTGNVTVSEQSELDKDFNNASSPQQIAGVAHKYIQLIDGKKQAMRQTYDENQAGRVNFGAAPSGGSGLAVNLKDAMNLPQNRGKSADEVAKDIEAHGHKVNR